MAKQMTKLAKRRLCEQAKLVKELEGEKLKLDFLRDCNHVHDALLYYLVRRLELTESDIEQIREAMAYLTRGL